MSRLRFAWLTLTATVAVSIWGAYVRATGSGAGCGSHWPLCDGELLPRSGTSEMLIEYSHRITSGIAFLAVVALWLALRRAPDVSPLAKRTALLSLILMSFEAALGASLVLFELVADNASMARAMFMAAHLVNTFALVAALTVTAWALSPSLSLALGRIGWPWYVAGAALLLTNVSGAVAALGDTLFPARSLGEALAQDLSVTSHLLLRLRLAHPAVAVASAAGVAMFASRLPQVEGRPAATRSAQWLVVALLVQLVAGATNVFLLAPVWLQLLHLLIANVIWILFVTTACLRAQRTILTASPALSR